MASIPSPPSNDPKPETGTSEHSNLHTAEEAFRYLGYFGRFRTIAIAGSRYLAFTSDVGEAFRPIFPPRLVTTTYAISWLYCAADVAFYGYSDYKQGKDSSSITRTLVTRSVFQSIASMGLPALTIHSTVRVFGKLFAKMGRYQRWGPTAMGLAVIPFLPVFDHPVEHSLDYIFSRFWPESKGASNNEETKKSH